MFRFIKSVVKLEKLRPLRRVHRRAFSRKFLLITNVTISCTLSCTGDLLEQQYEIYNEELDKWNKLRTVQMGISGITVGALCHLWYNILDKHLPGRTLSVVAKKIMLDQLICSPLYITLFFCTTGLLEHKNHLEILQEIREKAWKLFMAEWTVWPVAQFVNFYWLPHKYRVLYDSVISLGYDVYTSKVKHEK